MSTDPEATAKEWHLDPETEYRFELDPGTSLAVTVCLLYLPYRGSLLGVSLTLAIGLERPG